MSDRTIAVMLTALLLVVLALFAAAMFYMAFLTQS